MHKVGGAVTIHAFSTWLPRHSRPWGQWQHTLVRSQGTLRSNSRKMGIQPATFLTWGDSGNHDNHIHPVSNSYSGQSVDFHKGKPWLFESFQHFLASTPIWDTQPWLHGTTDGVTQNTREIGIGLGCKRVCNVCQFWWLKNCEDTLGAGILEQRLGHCSFRRRGEADKEAQWSKTQVNTSQQQ